MITLIALFILLFCPLLTQTNVLPQNLEKIAEELNQQVPVITNAPLPTLPSTHFRTKERLGASFMGGGVILLVASLIIDFMSTNPKTRAKVVPIYICSVGTIVISFLGRFCKLFPHTNNETTSWVAGAMVGLTTYVYSRSFYNK